MMGTDYEMDNSMIAARILANTGDLIDIKEDDLDSTSCRKLKDYLIGGQEIDFGYIDGGSGGFFFGGQERF